jgi:four helix bundle protein
MTNNLPSSYKNLIVYQKAKNLTVEAINYFSNKRLDKISEILINQFIRSISSIGANIAEGYGRHYQKNYRQFISIARGSSFESDYWLEVMLETKKFDNKIISEFSEKNSELIKILTTLMKNLEDRT